MRNILSLACIILTVDVGLLFGLLLGQVYDLLCSTVVDVNSNVCKRVRVSLNLGMIQDFLWAGCLIAG